MLPYPALRRTMPLPLRRGRGPRADGPRLVVLTGPARGTTVPLREGTTRLGRGEDADLRLDDATVSAAHAVVRRTAEGVHVEDVGSTNGTRRGEAPLTAFAPALLRHGDVLEIGAVAVLFLDAGGAPAAAALGRLTFDAARVGAEVDALLAGIRAPSRP